MSIKCQTRLRGGRAGLSRFAARALAAGAAAAFALAPAELSAQNSGVNINNNQFQNQFGNQNQFNNQFGNQGRFANQNQFQNRNNSSGSRFGNRSSGSRFGRNSRDSQNSFDSNDPFSRNSRNRGGSDSNSSERETRSERRRRESSSNNFSGEGEGRAGVGAAGTAAAIAADAAAAVPGRARLQGRSVLPKEAGGGGAGGGGGLEFPKYEISPLIVTETIYFSPPEVTAPADAKFTTPILFYNPDSKPIDRIDLWLKYEPELLDPAWIDLSALEPNLAEPMKTEIWRDRGTIHLAAQFATPLGEITNTLASIVWQAKGSGAQTEVRFAPPQGETNGIFTGETNLLGGSEVGNQGLISLLVELVDINADLGAIQSLAAGENPNLPIGRDTKGVHLALIPAEPTVFPGDVSTIDIALINPDVAEFDELRLEIRYDPETVEILDADEDNYLTAGTNIFDGDFHEAMPFELHDANEVDPRKGVIRYAARSSHGLRPYPSGTVARIVYRLKRESGQTAFWFQGLDPISGRFQSDVRAEGRSLLGPASGRQAEGLHNTRIGAAPL